MAMGMGMGLGLNNREGGGSCSSGGGNHGNNNNNSNNSNVSIVWFRRDLRVEDNPALTAGVRTGAVVAVYVWSPEEEGHYYPGRVSRWWLKQSLGHLDSSLRSLGVPLLTKRSLHSSLSALLHVIQATRATHLFFNHLYDPISLVRDHRIKQELSAQGIVVRSFNGDLLYEPWEINDEQGRPFTTFQAYWNKLLNMPYDPAAPLLPPKRIISGNVRECVSEELGLEDESEKGSNALLARAWVPGWSSADKALTAFINGPLMEYAANRRKADSATTSLLSPHLHFGELSVRKVFHLARMKQVYWANDGNAGGEESVNLFLRAIGLRDYSRYLSFHFPDSHERPLLAHLNLFPWSDDAQLFKAWRQGRTGYPLVDAGMRELWATGWLHDRIRVVVSSFFVKVLQLPWRWGMKYFWDTLLDADLECDALGWQYISGCLPDGRPLHRIDDPQLQGYNFDPAGEYVRRWLPELARLPTEWIHHPWDAPHAVLRAAGVELGSNYPLPVVELLAATRRLQHGLCLMWQRHTAATRTNLEGQGESPGQEQQQQQQQQQHHVGEAINMEVDGLNTNNNNIRTNDSTRRRQDQLVPSISINSSEQVLPPPLQRRNHGHDSNFSEHELSSSLDQAQAEVPMVMPMAVHMQLGRVAGSSNHVMDNIEEQEEVQQQQNHYYSESSNYSTAYSSSSSAVGGGRRRRGREAAAAAADVSVPVWTTSQGFQDDSGAAPNSESHSSQLQQNHSIASWRQRHASNQGNFSVMLDQGAGS